LPSDRHRADGQSRTEARSLSGASADHRTGLRLQVLEARQRWGMARYRRRLPDLALRYPCLRLLVHVEERARHRRAIRQVPNRSVRRATEAIGHNRPFASLVLHLRTPPAWRAGTCSRVSDARRDEAWRLSPAGRSPRFLFATGGQGRVRALLRGATTTELAGPDLDPRWPDEARHASTGRPVREAGAVAAGRARSDGIIPEVIAIGIRMVRP